MFGHPALPLPLHRPSFLPKRENHNLLPIINSKSQQESLVLQQAGSLLGLALNGGVAGDTARPPSPSTFSLVTSTPGSSTTIYMLMTPSISRPGLPVLSIILLAAGHPH